MTRKVSISAMMMYTLSNQTSTNCGLNCCQTNTLEPTAKSTNTSVAVFSLSSLKERKRTLDTMSKPRPIVTQNKGSGVWIDFWVICDSANCFLFFSDDNGHVYRAQTSLGSFPNGFGNTQIVLSDPNRFALFEAGNVYKVAGRNQYLMIEEGIGSTGRRYFRSFTATSLTGSWTPLAATENEPFAGRSNVTFPGGAWTQDISHGEMVRDGVDQTLTIDPCRLRYVYQGQDPGASGDYIGLPWRMGLLTQTNSPC